MIERLPVAFVPLSHHNLGTQVLHMSEMVADNHDQLVNSPREYLLEQYATPDMARKTMLQTLNESIGPTYHGLLYVTSLCVVEGLRSVPRPIGHGSITPGQAVRHTDPIYDVAKGTFLDYWLDERYADDADVNHDSAAALFVIAQTADWEGEIFTTVIADENQQHNAFSRLFAQRGEPAHLRLPPSYNPRDPFDITRSRERSQIYMFEQNG